MGRIGGGDRRSTLAGAAATQEVTKKVRLTGHGFATYEYTETTIDPTLAVGAGAVGVAGIGAWLVLLYRSGWRWRGKKVTLALGVVGATVVIAGVAAFLLTRERIPYRASEHYTSTDEIVDALRREGVECENPERAAPTSRFWSASVSCGIRSEFGVPDGFDDVSIHIWRDDDVRERWLADPANEEVDYVAAATWLVTCEFLPTCSDVRQALGGRLNVEY